MFIIGDEGCKHNRIPWMTGSLILLNLLAFGLQKWIGDPVTYGFSLVPAEITQLKDFTTPKETKMVIPVARKRARSSSSVSSCGSVMTSASRLVGGGGRRGAGRRARLVPRAQDHEHHQGAEGI